jgi:hypothetical protein
VTKSRKTVTVPAVPNPSLTGNRTLEKSQDVAADIGGAPAMRLPNSMAVLAMAAKTLLMATPTLVPAGRLHME